VHHAIPSGLKGLKGKDFSISNIMIQSIHQSFAEIISKIRRTMECLLSFIPSAITWLESDRASMGRNEQADCKEKAYIFGNATRNHL
jgi:hypothetical protein